MDGLRMEGEDGWSKMEGEDGGSENGGRGWME